MRQSARGFTLVEVLIVVVILGMLSVLAYPSYVGHVQRSNRTDARAALTRVANDLERFFATNGAYTADMSNLSLNVVEGVAYSEGGYYTVAVAAGPSGAIATSYVITATPVEGGPQASDDDCPAFTLNSIGVRTPAPAGSACW